MAQSISQEAIGATGLPGATAASRYAGATASGAPTTGTFAVGDFIVDQSGSTWICTASSQTASATTASGNGNLITFTASNSFSPGQYVNVTGFSNTGYNVSNAVIGSASSTQFTVISSATGTTTGTGTAVTTGTWQLSGVPINENIAGKNFVINGGMDIAQRGTSQTFTAGPAYSLDRWTFNCSAATSITTSQISSGLTGIQYAMRTQRTSGNTSTPLILIANALETKNSIPIAGQTVTFSFWARAGSNWSVTGNAFNASLITGTGTDQNLYSGFTGSLSIVNQTVTPSTSWQRFTYTATASTNMTQIGVQFYYFTTGTAGANDYLDITGVQLEIASQATPFSRAGGSIGGELALCQRYFQLLGPGDLFGTPWSSTQVALFSLLKVTMRTTPSSVTVSTLTNNLNVIGSGNPTPSSAWGISTSTASNLVIYNSSFSSLNIGWPCDWYNGTISLSAEL